MSDIQIVTFSPELRSFFASINKAWVTKYFTMEHFDYEQLDDPETNILVKGGQIYFAKLDGEVVGTVGLVAVDADTCEMIKMGVDPEAQGKGVGMALGQAVLAGARERGFTKMVLYSNTKLSSAMRLYERLGFEEVELEDDTYERCDIKMELTL